MDNRVRELRDALEDLLNDYYRVHPRGETLKWRSSEDLAARARMIGPSFNVKALLNARAVLDSLTPQPADSPFVAQPPCTCICHKPGMTVNHLVACCVGSADSPEAT